jgi:hypothetical protein
MKILTQSLVTYKRKQGMGGKKGTENLLTLRIERTVNC